MSLDTSDIPSSVKSLLGLSDDDLLDELRAAAKLGVFDQSLINRVMEAKKAGLISGTDLAKILGVGFSGDAAFSTAWNQLVNGLLDGASDKVDAAKAAYETLIKTLKGLPSDFGSSDLLQSALVGLQDPLTVAKKAAALGEKLGVKYASEAGTIISNGPDFVKLLSEHDYTNAWKSLDNAVLPLLKGSPQGQAIYGLVSTAQNSFTQLSTVAKNADKNAGIDASGAVSVATVALNLVKAACAVVRQYGSAKDQMIAENIEAWASVAAGCASTISAGSSAGPWGTAAGAAVCAFSVVTQILTYFETYKVPNDTQEMVLFYPTKNQLPLIAKDAQRLALVLRLQYGIPSYAWLYTTLEKFSRFLTVDFPTAESTTKRTAGFSLLDVAKILSSGKYLDVVTTLRNVAPTRVDTEEDVTGLSESGSKLTLEHIYEDAGDVNVAAVEAFAKYEQRNFKYTGETYPSPKTHPWTVVDELLGFFAAVTAFDVAKNPGVIDYFNPPKAELPIRLWASTKNHRAAPDLADAGDHYSESCWTCLSHCDEDNEDDGTRLTGVTGCKNLGKQVLAGDACATKEMAAIRLMAAFSYLNLVYHWSQAPSSTSTTSKPYDMIAELGLDTADPAVRLVAPLNPRSMWYAFGQSWITPDWSRLKDDLFKLNTVVEKMKSDIEAAVKTERLAYQNRNVSAMISAGMMKKLQAATGQSGRAAEQREVAQSAKARLQAAIGSGTLKLTPEFQDAKKKAETWSGIKTTAVVGGLGYLGYRLWRRYKRR